MARVRMVDGRVFDVPDSDATMLDYYRGEGAEVVLDHDLAAAVAELAAWVEASTVPEVLDRVAAEPEIAGQVLEVEQSRGDDARVTLLDLALQALEQTHPGFGEPMHGVEAPADGTPVEISSDDGS